MARRKWQAAFLILTIAFIWGNSLIPVDLSTAESGRVRELLQPALGILFGQGNLTDYLVRKLAHFVEFAVLGLQLLLWEKGDTGTRFVRSIELAFLVAFFDESIQVFSQRGAQIIDVWIDLSGVVFGSLVGVLVLVFAKRHSMQR